jgi:phosphoglycolate phosphatase
MLKSKEKLILFDIDGILIRSLSVGASAQVFKKYFDLNNYPKIYAEGKTHRQILFERLKKIGILKPENDPRFEKALTYQGTVFRELTKKMNIPQIPNVEQFIKKALAEGIFIGILTGNTRDIAKVKLKKSGLLKYFKFGAYGDRIMDRNKLVPIAIKNARKATGIDFRKENVFVIGDTIRDIRCAKAGGVRSIAVSTGEETFQKLKKAKPDYLFNNFNDVKKLVNIIKKDNF